MYYGKNVFFLNPHYREIRTMGGRTNRGPGVFSSLIDKRKKVKWCAIFYPNRQPKKPQSYLFKNIEILFNIP